ncbi:hypothetical protein EDB80DRAFT_784328 [Ilyonectria destructans]|nr:hypothetical protein EDB80DRAFT_784328 [Ilyonectria destructans]
MAVHKHTVWQKDRFRKRTKTAKPRTVKLGKDCNTFAFMAFYNPTHDILDGSIWVPEGQSIPDLNGLANRLWSSQQTTQTGPLRRSTRAKKQTYNNNDNSKTTRKTANKSLVRPQPKNQRRSRRQGGAKESSPVLHEITVAESDTESIHEDAGVYSIPVTPEPVQSDTGSTFGDGMAVTAAETAAEAEAEVWSVDVLQAVPTPQHEPTHDDAYDTQDLLNMQLGGATNQGAEGEPHEPAQDGMPFGYDAIGPSSGFSAILESDGWIGMPMTDDPDLANMDVDFNFDLGLDMNFDTPNMLSPLPHQATETAAMDFASNGPQMPLQQAQPPSPAPLSLPLRQKTTKITSAECASRLQMFSNACNRVLYDPKIRSRWDKIYDRSCNMPRMPRGMQHFPALEVAC